MGITPNIQTYRIISEGVPIIPYRAKRGNHKGAIYNGEHCMLKRQKVTMNILKELALIFTSFVTVIFATYFGAATAFRLNVRHDKSKQISKNKASLIKAEFVIDLFSLAHDDLRKFILQSIKTWNEGSGRFFSWEELKQSDLGVWMPTIEMDSLLFLLECGEEGKKTLNGILLVNMENQSVGNILKKRNQNYDVYLDKIADQYPAADHELIDMIGKRLHQQLTQYTDYLINTNLNFLEDIEDVKKKVKVFLKNY